LRDPVGIKIEQRLNHLNEKGRANPGKKTIYQAKTGYGFLAFGR
ncbi:unnamed protein product, partial [marine sediment metagenome]